jgi:outer membrane translocation and assembly module TamA
MFADTAHASHPFRNGDARWHLDMGAGVRFVLPGAGIVRVDLARGVRDGAMAFSVGWIK